MRDGEFIVAGILSRDLKTVIQNRPTFIMPRRKSSSFESPWQSGTVYFDQDAYENTPLNLIMYMESKNFEEAEENRNRLVHVFDTGDYVDFIHYADPQKVYSVKLEEMEFSGTRAIGFGNHVAASFSVKPFKRQKNIPPIITTAKSVEIMNPYRYHSKPIITLEGTGDCTLMVNGDPFVIKNITGKIIIDSVVEHSYRHDGQQVINENKKIYTLDYPVLLPGKNTITYSENITKITVEPRWQTLI